MNVPTQLTVARALLALVIVALLLWRGWIGPLLAIIVFMVASLTDWLDGYLARRWGQTSPLGALLDPLADKVLVLGVLAVFAHRALIPWWIVGVLFAREALVTMARAWAATRGTVLGAAQEGKQKLVCQLLAISCCMVVMLLDGLAMRWPQVSPVRPWLYGAGLFALGASVTLAVTSGASFFWHNRRVWRASHG